MRACSRCRVPRAARWPALRRESVLLVVVLALARKQAALAAHQSQFVPRSAGQGAVLGAAIRSRAAWRSEYFFV